MKKLFNMKKFSALLLSAALLVVVGCGKTEDKLTVSPGTLSFPYDGGSQTVTLKHASAGWTFNELPAWINLTYPIGAVPTELTVTVIVDPNPTATPRSTTVTFISGGETANLTVNVAANPNPGGPTVAPNITGAWTLTFYDRDAIYPERLHIGNDWVRVPENITRNNTNLYRFYFCDFLAAEWGQPKLILDFDTVEGEFLFKDIKLPNHDGQEMWQIPLGVHDATGDVYRISDALVYYVDGSLDADYEIELIVDGQPEVGYVAFATFLETRNNDDIHDLIESASIFKSSTAARKSGATRRKTNRSYSVSSADFVGNINDLNLRKK